MSSSTQRAHDGDDKTVPVVDPQPNLPAWKRAALVVLLAVLVGLALRLWPSPTSQPNVIYASRYSKEFKYRPAASPVITERLKDGRIRLRGALPS